MRLWVLALAVLAGCQAAPKDGSASFVVNQSAKGSQQAPGKSYAVRPAHLRLQGDSFRLETGDAETAVTLSGAGSKLGEMLAVKEGELRLNGKIYPLEQGQLVVQNRQDQLVRGNFNARVRGGEPPWEVVGSFDAVLEP